MLDKDFNELLNKSLIYEKLVIKNYKNRGFTIEDFNPGVKQSEYDFKAIRDDKIRLIEVKSDFIGHKTGNIAIEFKSNNILSGINITKARYYFYFIVNGDKYDVYKISVSKLKKMIKDKKYIRTVSGGYNCLSECYLFKLSLFKDNKINLKL